MTTTRHMLITGLATAAAASSAAASSAAAVTWTPTVTLPGRNIDLDRDGPPVAAINRKGDTIVAWHGANGTSLSVGNRAGFSKPRSPWRRERGEVDVAMGPRGQAIATFQAATDDAFSDLETYYVMVSRTGRISRPRRLAPQPAIAWGVAAQQDGSFVVAYETLERGGNVLRAVRIGDTGRSGRRSVVAPHVPDDAELTPSTTAAGGLVLCCVSRPDTSERLWTFVPGAGWDARSFRPAAHERIGTATASGGQVLLANATFRTRQNATPTLRFLGERRARRVKMPALPAPSRAVAGSVDGQGRGVVTYTIGTDVHGIVAREDGTLSAPVKLGQRRGTFADDLFTTTEPLAVPFGRGALVAWVDRARLQVASQDGGTFAPAQAPTGRADEARLISAGSAAALVWYDNGHRAHVSITAP